MLELLIKGRALSIGLINCLIVYYLFYRISIYYFVNLDVIFNNIDDYLMLAIFMEYLYYPSLAFIFAANYFLVFYLSEKGKWVLNSITLVVFQLLLNLMFSQNIKFVNYWSYLTFALPVFVGAFSALLYYVLVKRKSI